MSDKKEQQYSFATWLCAAVLMPFRGNTKRQTFANIAKVGSCAFYVQVVLMIYLAWNLPWTRALAVILTYFITHLLLTFGAYASVETRIIDRKREDRQHGNN